MPKSPYVISYLSTFMSYSVLYYYILYYSKQFNANCENHNEISLEKISSVRKAKTKDVHMLPDSTFCIRIKETHSSY